MLIATLLLGSAVGPEEQGNFSHTKAAIEFAAAFAMFGLPQALFFYVKSGRLSLQAALRWTWASALVAVLVGMIFGVVQQEVSSSVQAAVFASAIALCVAHGHLRALLLVGKHTGWFNAATALPQVLLIGGVIVVLWFGITGNSTWQLLFAMAYGASSVFALWQVKKMGKPVAGSPADWRELGRYGIAAWLLASLSTAAILLVQQWVESAQGSVALGRFTMAMTLVQVPLAPIGYAAPLLFRRWMEQSGGRSSQRWAAALCAALLFVAAALWLAAPTWPHLGLGPAYAGTTQAFAVLMMGAAAEAASRVLTVNVYANGLPWLAVKAEIVRWLVLCGAWLLLPSPGLLSMCAVWAAGAWAAAAVFVLHSYRLASSDESTA
ncbi:hypothetical protein LJR130_005676 [Variovorax sp. LjRoot130]|uniref:hypothetical protein n=1 Tax=Variovorax sp. LjRoot130 TaxID=3342261 RepID=UPI003ECCFD12